MGLLKRADYLSTVSGGGYIGSHLSSVLNDPALGDPWDAETGGTFPVQKELGAREPVLLNHLRNCGNYLVPRGLFSHLRLPTIVLRGLLLNLFLFAPMVLLAVEVTEIAYALTTLGSSEHVTPSIVLLALAMIFLLLVLTFPFVSRVFRRKLGWNQRNTYDKLLTGSLALILIGVQALIVVLILNAAVTYPWTDIWFHLEKLLSPLEPGGYWQAWVIGLAAMLVMFIAARASGDPTKLASKIFLYSVGIIGPAILFAVYLVLCVLEIDTPYLSKKISLDLNQAVEESGNDPRLRRACRPVTDFADPELRSACADLSDTLVDFQRRRGFGRAIAAPQIGVDLRIVAMGPVHGPPLLINPEITWRSPESMTLWDDCMSFPDLLVRLRRARSISLRYRDADAGAHQWKELGPGVAELLQHEIDHLDGVLAVDHGLDRDAIVLRAVFESDPDRFRSQVDWPPAG